MKLLVLFTLLLTSIFQSDALAQDTLNQPDGINTQQDNTVTTTTEDNSGFNWWWLLPLALLPLIPILTRKDEEATREQTPARGEYERVAYHDIDKHEKDRQQNEREEAEENKT